MTSNHSSLLHYASDEELSYLRQRKGSGFHYLDQKGNPLAASEKERVEKLVIPPAWENVRICCEEGGHIQAVGYDAKGRKQYIYHPEWMLQNQGHKFDKMVKMGEVLPTIRETVAGHMRQHSLSRERVVATVVWLLDHTFIRVGNQQYVKENSSYGLTTLREKHVDVEGTQVFFSFKGKSGVYHEHQISHPRVAKTVRQCIELPGYQVFQYLDENGQRQGVDSRDVNEYLHQISGESFSAKDFRTWGGSTLTGRRLYELGNAENETQLKKNVRAAVKEVAQHLGNTITVCRKYYVHPKVIDAYSAKKLVKHFDRIFTEQQPNTTKLSTDEYAVWTLLR